MKSFSSVANYKTIAGNNLLLMVLVLITLILYSTSYIKFSTLMNELTLLFSTESDETVNYSNPIFNVFNFKQ